jgi:hypothetical protein
VVRVRQHEARVTRGKACCGRQLDKGRARSGRRCGWPGHGDSVRVGPGAANSCTGAAEGGSCELVYR